MAPWRAPAPAAGVACARSALVAAVAIALASTAAVVLSEDPQTLRLAVVGALWAFVLAAFAAPRRREPEAADAEAMPGTELELRRTYEIELEKEVAARREYELQLEVYLRRELERGLAEDVAALRDEVGRMRGEMIDRLDGELRMERIETTRLIGGSLRALQDEARRLGIGLPVRRSWPSCCRRTRRLRAATAPRRTAPRPVTAGLGAPTADRALVPRRRCRPRRQPAYGADAAVPAPSRGPPTPAYGAGPRRRRRRAPAYGAGPPAPAAAARRPAPAPDRAAGPPAPRGAAPRPGRVGPPRRRRAREDGEDNEVMSRLLGR